MEYYNKILSLLEKPYFRNLNSIGIYNKQWEEILTKVFDQPIKFRVARYGMEILNDNHKRIYYEQSDGKWEEWKYDDNDNQVYYEDSYGSWVIKEYDEYGYLIFYDTSEGIIRDHRNK